VNESGEMLGKFGFREKLQSGDLNLEHAKIEVIAQIRYFIELFGKKPTHFDSHQHVYLIYFVYLVNFNLFIYLSIILFISFFFFFFFF